MQARLDAVKAEVALALEQAILAFPAGELREAMGYACTGGKRIRAFLVMESARLHNVPDSAALPVAAAVEALHAYSLVHDDLPAMDDDDLRRGQPTTHIRFNEATAILAGDALQSMAFGLLASDAVGSAAVRVALVQAFADAVGARGMVYGQMLDIAAESADQPLTLEEITRLQDGKTGALIAFSAMAGALLAGADPAPLAQYARNLGLAFQIADDILDVTGDEAATGKRVGKDDAAGKATFVSLLGLEGAREMERDLIARGNAALVPYAERAGNLRELARFVIERHA
ncbi:polyprenyl synthetase family protein [Paracoccus aminophilus]|uniref:Geranylgeranyl diphosphate synthase n=1 Tax=Paracoccus aminophilus JCM 7686 TaxID=1367847 RepID=S5XJI1_PARAH|nr:farnesyl diphosphate synthase [Paracoccus aminophilus]AGT07339.1 geranyltranstransferase [Paracoccus aminophilus JCM 7686]